MLTVKHQGTNKVDQNIEISGMRRQKFDLEAARKNDFENNARIDNLPDSATVRTTIFLKPDSKKIDENPRLHHLMRLVNEKLY